MRALLYTGLIAVAVATITTAAADEHGFSAIYTYDHAKAAKRVGEAPAETINIRQADPDTLNQIMEGTHPDVSLEISEGDQIPLCLFLRGDFVELIDSSESAVFVKFKKNLYLRNVDGVCVCSIDNREWKPIMEWITGTASVELGVENPGEPVVTLGAELFERKENSPRPTSD
ncbi:MAG: hypothetical protein WB791_03225 [Waddliaceae bacterium]